MASKRIEFTVSEGLWDRIEGARGYEPRAAFIKRTLESALGSSLPQASKAGIGRAESGTDGPRTSPASARASEVPALDRADLFRRMTRQ